MNGGKGARWRFYACSTRHFRSQYSRRHNAAVPHMCIGKSVDAEDLERQVWDQIVTWADKPGPLLRELAAQFQSATAHEASAREEAERIQAEREQLQDQRDRIITLYRIGELTEADLRHQLRELSTAEGKLVLDAERAQDAVRKGEEAKAAVEDARSVLAVLRAELASGTMTEARKREIVESLVSEIKVHSLPAGISTRGNQKYEARTHVDFIFERPETPTVGALPAGADGSTALPV
jgi:hypothetical protein